MIVKRTKKELSDCYALRNAWHRSGLYWEALRSVKVGSNQYTCQGCKGVFKLREVQVDHIEPVVSPTEGWCGLQQFAFRLYCPSSQLQVLCQDKCHLEKSKKENRQR